MREIKGKQWNKRNKEWFPIGMVKEGQWASPFSLDFDNNPIVLYTGLKDKNGREIYEGDILRNTFSNILGKVNMIDGSWCKDTLWLSESIIHQQEVIGNIYENPDLIDRGDAVSKSEGKGR